MNISDDPSLAGLLVF